MSGRPARAAAAVLAAAWLAGCSLPLREGQESVPAGDDDGRSPLTRHYDLDKRDGALDLKPHHATFVAAHGTDSRNPVSNPSPDEELTHGEIAFQFSVKTKLVATRSPAHADLWFAYTQQSHWQVFQVSGPIRETNYEPEAFVVQPLGRWGDWGAVALRFVGLGLNHQSNGRGGGASRSWNRVVGQFGFELGSATTLLVRPWWRIDESAFNDENPDIDEYLGHGDLLLAHRMDVLGRDVTATLRVRNNLEREGNRGALQLSLAWPVLNDRLALFVRAFTGYGESLIDYDHRQQTIAVGVSLLDWD